MKALVTGATGFIGGALATKLVREGWEVSVLLRPGSASHLKNAGLFRVIEADLAQPESLPAALAPLEVDVVVHAAAIRNRWGTPPQAYYTVNVAATETLLRTLAGRAKRFVYLSSVGVFGRPGVLNIGETFPVEVAASWDYHSSKAAGERLTLGYADQIEAVVVRPTITYGPGDASGMVTRLIQMVSRRRFLQIGDGSNYIHLTYIDDLVAGLQLAMTHPRAAGEIFILAGEHPIQVKSLLTRIEEITRSRLPGGHIPEGFARTCGAVCETVFRVLPPTWEPPITRDKVDNLCVNRSFSWEKAASILGYQPQWTCERGLAATIAWLNEQKGQA